MLAASVFLQKIENLDQKSATFKPGSEWQDSDAVFLFQKQHIYICNNTLGKLRSLAGEQPGIFEIINIDNYYFNTPYYYNAII